MHTRSITFALLALLVLASASHANQRPVLIHEDSFTIKEEMRLTFSVNGNDPDGDPLTFSATNLPRGASFEGRTFTWTPDFDQDGTHRVRFTVTDNHGAYDSDTIPITVLDVNHGPVIDSVYPYEGRTVEFQEKSARRFTIEATDPDGDSLKYKWLIDGKTKGRSSSFLYDPDYDDAGQHTLEASVSDGKVEKSVTWSIIITDNNRAPRFTRNVIDLFAEEGKLLEFTANAKDDDKDAIVFTATKLPKGAGLDSATGKFTWIPDLNQRGYYEVAVKASDGKGGNAWRSFFITVTNSTLLERLDRAQRAADGNNGDETITMTRTHVISGSSVSHERTEEIPARNYNIDYTIPAGSSFSYSQETGTAGRVIEEGGSQYDATIIVVIVIIAFAVVAGLIFLRK